MLKTIQSEGSLEVRARPSECYERLQLEALEPYFPPLGARVGLQKPTEDGALRAAL